MWKPIFLGLVFSAAFGSPPAVAQAEPAPTTSAGDPNERVCENLSQVGSRLAKRRVCSTRAEWEDRKRQDRQAVEQIQKQIGGPCQTTPSARNGGPTAC